MMTIRASALQLVGQCAAAASRGEGEVVLGGRSEASDLGTSIHNVILGGIGGKDVDVLTEAKKLGLDADELHMTTAWAWKIWKEIEGYFPNPQIEPVLSWTDDEAGVTLTGHPDVMSEITILDDPQFGVSEVRIADFKSGHLSIDHTQQLMAYAFLAMARLNFAVSRVYVAALNIRSLSWDAEYYSANDVMGWYAWLLGHLKGKTYNPGRHCSWCPRRVECDAYAGTLSLAVRGILGETEPHRGWAMAGDEILGRLYERVQLVEKAAAQAKEMIRAHVSANGGRMAISDREELVIDQQERTPIINPSKALPVLREVLTEEQVSGCIRISKTDVMDAVAANTPRGRKKAAIEDMKHRLEDAGAIGREVVERLVVKTTKRALPILQHEVSK